MVVEGWTNIQALGGKVAELLEQGFKVTLERTPGTGDVKVTGTRPPVERKGN